MIFYPYDYDMMRMAEERRKRIIRQMEDTNADYEYIQLVLGRFSGWLGRRLVKFAERIEVKPKPQEQTQF